MHIDFVNIFLFISCFPILFLIYYLLKQEGKKNTAGKFLSVYFTSEQIESEKIKNVKKAYLSLLKAITIFLAIIPFTTLFIKRSSINYTVWMVWILLLITVEFIPVIKGNKRLRQIKINEGWYEEKELDEGASEQTKQAFYENDDNNWKYGMFYYNKNDKRVLINKNIGSGSTVNMASKIGKVLIVIAVVSLLIIPFSCAWMIADEFTPVEMSLNENSVIAKHRNDKLEIKLNNIKEVKLVDASDLTLTKSTGTALDTVCVGRFYVKSYGGCDVCYNPENDDAIMITLKNDDKILMGDDNNNETKKLYDEIQEKMVK